MSCFLLLINKPFEPLFSRFFTCNPASSSKASSDYSDVNIFISHVIRGERERSPPLSQIMQSRFPHLGNSQKLSLPLCKVYVDCRQLRPVIGPESTFTVDSGPIRDPNCLRSAGDRRLPIGNVGFADRRLPITCRRSNLNLPLNLELLRSTGRPPLIVAYGVSGKSE